MNVSAAAISGGAIKEGFTNMLIGLLVVFTVLIFLSLVIYCFRFLNKAGTKPVVAPTAQATPAAPASAPAPVVKMGPGKMENSQVNVADEVDGQTAAVILAALAEECGGNFTVKSIKKAK